VRNKFIGVMAVLLACAVPLYWLGKGRWQ